MSGRTKKPKLLDFIRQRNSREGNAAASTERMPSITKEDRLFAEIQHDESLAKKRDASGKDHANEDGIVPEALLKERAIGRMENRVAARNDKARARSKSDGRDFPF